MKKLATVTTVLLVAMFAMSCQTSSSEKLKEAKAEADNADEHLTEAKEEYLADMEKYKMETAVKIAANEQSIKEFKARVASNKNDAKADYDVKIKNLEEKNTDMKRKIDEYQIEGKDKWESFKTEFSHDMDELGKALKDLTVDNKK